MSASFPQNMPVASFSLRLVYARLVAVSVIWGGTFVAGRFLSSGVAPMLAASLRFVLASATLALVLALTRTQLAKPTLRQAMVLAALGFFGIFTYNLCFFYGLHFTSASRASLIVSLNPAAIALASRVLFGEKLTVARLGGIALCLAGAGLVITSRDNLALAASASWTGDALILGCVASWVIYSACSRNISGAIGPLLTVAYSVWFGTLMLCAATLLMGDVTLQSLQDISLPQFSSLLYLGALGSALAYLWYYDAIRRIGATRTGAFISLNPVSAVLLGGALLGEPLTWTILFGGALAVSGIYLCNRGQG